MQDFYRLDVYVPQSHLESLKNALFAAGAGKLGDYDRCCWQTRGVGQFRPGDDAEPFQGAPGRDERSDEWKIEMIVPADCKDAVIAALKENHPYETPAFQYWTVNID